MNRKFNLAIFQSRFMIITVGVAATTIEIDEIIEKCIAQKGNCELVYDSLWKLATEKNVHISNTN